MKLIYCPDCNDVVKLRPRQVKSCECGASSGQYLDLLVAEIYGKAIPIGISNDSLAKAIISPHKDDNQELGVEVTAFVIPDTSPNIRRQKSPSNIVSTECSCAYCQSKRKINKEIMLSK